MNNYLLYNLIKRAKEESKTEVKAAPKAAPKAEVKNKDTAESRKSDKGTNIGSNIADTGLAIAPLLSNLTAGTPDFSNVSIDTGPSLADFSIKDFPLSRLKVDTGGIKTVTDYNNNTTWHPSRPISGALLTGKTVPGVLDWVGNRNIPIVSSSSRYLQGKLPILNKLVPVADLGVTLYGLNGAINSARKGDTDALMEHAAYGTLSGMATTAGILHALGYTEAATAAGAAAGYAGYAAIPDIILAHKIRGADDALIKEVNSIVGTERNRGASADALKPGSKELLAELDKAQKLLRGNSFDRSSGSIVLDGVARISKWLDSINPITWIPGFTPTNKLLHDYAVSDVTDAAHKFGKADRVSRIIAEQNGPQDILYPLNANVWSGMTVRDVPASRPLIPSIFEWDRPSTWYQLGNVLKHLTGERRREAALNTQVEAVRARQFKQPLQLQKDILDYQAARERQRKEEARSPLDRLFTTGG